MKKYYLIVVLLIEIALVIYYGSLRIQNSHNIKEPRSFGDTNDYFHNADLPVFSREFWVDERPPVTALFWKFADSNPDTIHTVQLFFSIISWAVLAFTISFTVQNLLVKIVAFVITLAFSLSRDIFMWDAFLGSESIGLSFLALFLAAALWTLQAWRTYKFFILILLALFLALTRDTYAYLLLMIALINVPVFAARTHRNAALLVSLAFIAVFVLVTNLAGIALRPYRAILMNTAWRIYPVEEYVDYFRKRGMPIDEELVTIANDLATTSRRLKSGEKFTVYLALESDPNQVAFRNWALENGSFEYMRFLWFFKVDTMQNVILQTPYESFSPDVYYYTATGYEPIINDVRTAEILYPARFGVIFFFAANCMAFFLVPIAWIQNKYKWYIPLLMILLSYPQAVLIWAADVNDIARHSVPHSVLLHLGVWFIVFYIADDILQHLVIRFPAPVKNIFVNKFRLHL